MSSIDVEYVCRKSCTWNANHSTTISNCVIQMSPSKYTGILLAFQARLSVYIFYMQYWALDTLFLYYILLAPPYCKISPLSWEGGLSPRICGGCSPHSPQLGSHASEQLIHHGLTSKLSVSSDVAGWKLWFDKIKPMIGVYICIDIV